MTPCTEAIKDISKGRVVVVAAGSGAEADQALMEEGGVDRRAGQHSQPLGGRALGGGRAGAVPGIWDYTSHQDRHSVPFLCNETDLGPSSSRVGVAQGRA